MRVADQVYKRTEDQSTLFRLVMTPLALIYSMVVWTRNRLFDYGWKRANRLDQPVISVGNIAAGGTGKSPVVGYLASLLVARGHKPAILSRGYGSGLGRGNAAIYLAGDLVKMATPGRTLHPDEPRMLSASHGTVPVVLCSDRYKGAAFLQDSMPGYRTTHWLLDDGFQHRQLKRDVDLVLLDARNPLGNGYTLPLGSLRELPSSLTRADAVIFTRAGTGCPSEKDQQRIRSQIGDHSLCLSARFLQEEPRLVLGEAKSLDQGVNLVCAVAQPGRLLNAFQRAGFKITNLLVKADHSPISLQDIHLHCNLSLPVITTEKDYWRDEKTFEKSGLSVYVIPMKVEMQERDQERVLNLILR